MDFAYLTLIALVAVIVLCAATYAVVEEEPEEPPPSVERGHLPLPEPDVEDEDTQKAAPV